MNEIPNDVSLENMCRKKVSPLDHGPKPIKIIEDCPKDLSYQNTIIYHPHIMWINKKSFHQIFKIINTIILTRDNLFR